MRLPRAPAVAPTSGRSPAYTGIKALKIINKGEKLALLKDTFYEKKLFPNASESEYVKRAQMAETMKGGAGLFGPPGVLVQWPRVCQRDEGCFAMCRGCSLHSPKSRLPGQLLQTAGPSDPNNPTSPCAYAEGRKNIPTAPFLTRPTSYYRNKYKKITSPKLRLSSAAHLLGQQRGAWDLGAWSAYPPRRVCPRAPLVMAALVCLDV